MTDVYSLLDELGATGIRLYEHDGKIRVSDPRGSLNDHHRQRIRVLRPQLLDALSAPPQSVQPILQKRTAEDPPPLSFAQRRLWLLDQLTPGSGSYNIPAVIRLDGDLDVSALERSLEYLITRHDSLRTTFVQPSGDRGGEPVQQIHAPSGFTLPVISVEDGESLRALAAAEGAAGFDLRQGPLVRARLVRISGRQHVLLLTLHHIICDGWSLGILTRELAAAYTAYSQAADPMLAELPIQYADFAVWQRAHLSGPTLERHLSYWRGCLSGAPALLELPVDRPRAPAQSFRGSHFKFHLSDALTSDLNHLASETGATLFMLLLTAFKVLLARYTGQTDIVVGTPVANRTRAGMEGLAGFFVNTLAVRTTVDDDATYTTLLHRVREGLIGALQHQDLPFEQLVAELGIERTLSQNPIFQVMFAFHKLDVEPLTLANLKASIEPAELPFSRFDLTFDLAEIDGRLDGMIEYSTDLFDESTIDRMAGHFDVLLRGIVNQPDQPVLRLPLLTQAERRQIVEQWNGPEVDFGAPVPMHVLFERQAERTPDRIAVAPDVTYSELNARSNQLARHLISLSVRAGSLVAVALERSSNLVVSLLAVLKAGAAYVPIDPNYPGERVQYLLSDSGAQAMLTESHLVLAAGSAVVVELDRIGEKLALHSRENPDLAVSAADLVYVIYTSGSTGQPKGVMVQHDGLYNLVRWHQSTFEVTKGDRASQMANPAFDATGWEIWPYLTTGATLVFAPGEARFSPSALAQWLAEQRITIAFVPTPIANSLLQAKYGLPLRWLLTGGDRLTHYPPSGASFALVNNYGPTENTVVATSGVVAQNPAPMAPHIGKPISNVGAYILDKGLQPAPIGVPGELCLGGAQLARGYWNRPDLTSERFFDHPEFGRLYKTADLCRWLPDGKLEFLRRVDRQVKIRGFRIELGEIEHAMIDQAGVRDAAVIVREERPGDFQLRAFFTGEAMADSVRADLARRLPDYMVPATIARLEAMPVTSNGKLDRRSLELLDGPSAQSGFVAPRDFFEEQIAAIWREVLKTDRVGAHDNFFALGGHSLLATQVISRVRTLLTIEVPLKTLFEASELAGFAGRVRQRHADAFTGGPALVRRTRSGETGTPLSFAQKRLWFLDQLEPGSALYNIPSVLRLSGQLNVAALERSLTYLIARHESLRTTFDRASDGEPVQVIRPAWTVCLSAGSPDGAIAPFDLRTGPVVRLALVKRAEQEHLLSLTLHHSIADGWSIGILLRELSVVYQAYAEGREPSLPALPIQYTDFAMWQREYLTGELLDRQLSFWRGHLTGAPALLELPVDRPRPATRTYSGTQHSFAIDAQLTAKLQSLAQCHDATLFMVLLSAFNVLLARYSRQADIVVGTPIANRNREETEGVVGSFVNMLAIRTRLDDNPAFTELLRRVREATLSGYEHQDLPFERLVDELAPQRALSYSPLFQVVFVLQNVDIQPLALPGLVGVIEPAEFPFAKFDLTLNLRETGDGLLGILEYNSDLFDASTVARMADHFDALLGGILSASGEPVYRLPMLAAEPVAPMADFGPGETIHAMFERQVERAPDSVALTFEGEQVTYSVLNARANRLACRLMEGGVRPGTLVPVVMGRTPELIVSLLAVLKAGGAYVPIDPTYPPERIAFTLRDCGAALVLTDRCLADGLPQDGTRYVFASDPLTAYPDTNPASGATADHLAYVIYTSGSTGQPKGALIPHCNVWRLFAATDAWFGFGAADVWTLFHSAAFDFSVWEMWGALCYGGRLVIVPYAVSRDPQAFLRMLSEQRVTVLNQTPSAFRQLVAVDGQDPRPLTLRYVIFGGEALEFESLRPWFARHGDTAPQLVNMYGITETTVHVTYQPICVEDLDRHRGRSRIGCAIPDLRLHILDAYGLDAYGAPVPVGVAGELHVGGAGLARGYLNRPELTAERFFEHPEFGRLYKTGDLCRWLPDGNMEYLGRTDFQVKIRGFRVELGEIESALMSEPGVREAVALVREDQPGDQRIVAYVVGSFDGESDRESIRERLARRLPEYMVPSAFVRLESMPLTANGKLDRGALPVPDAASVPRVAYVEPQDGLEARIAAIWSRVLDLDQVGLYDNFFDLGGNSLLIIKVRDELREALQRNVAVVDLFRHPTVHELARYFQSEDRPKDDSASMQATEQTRADKQRAARMRRRQAAGQHVP